MDGSRARTGFNSQLNSNRLTRSRVVFLAFPSWEAFAIRAASSLRSWEYGWFDDDDDDDGTWPLVALNLLLSGLLILLLHLWILG